MNKLQQISTLSAAFLSGIPLAESQVTYIDFDPDLVLNTTYDENDIQLLAVDMDEDGVNDFSLGVSYVFVDSGWGPVYSRFVAYELNSNRIAGTNVNDDYFSFYYGLPYKMESGDLINADLNWISENIYPGLLYANDLGPTEFRGNWQPAFGTKKKFLPVALNQGGETHYGWLRVTLLSDPSFVKIIVLDAAFQAEPNTPIAAGEGIFTVCLPPADLVSDAAATSAKLKWNEAAGATTYKLNYRNAAIPGFTTKFIYSPKHSKILSGLSCNTDYLWKVATSCDGGLTYSDFSPLESFSTTACKIGENENEETILFPIPAENFISVTLADYDETKSISVFDITGEKVLLLNTNETGSFQLDISDLPSGVYILSIKSENIQLMKKFIK